MFCEIVSAGADVRAFAVSLASATPVTVAQNKHNRISRAQHAIRKRNIRSGIQFGLSVSTCNTYARQRICFFFLFFFASWSEHCFRYVFFFISSFYFFLSVIYSVFLIDLKNFSAISFIICWCVLCACLSLKDCTNHPTN